MKIALRDKSGNPLPGKLDVFETVNPNLCIHPSLFEPTAMFGNVAEAWTVTHIRSGASIISLLPSRRVAEAAVVWLTKQPMDWSTDFNTVSKAATEDFKQLIHEARRVADAYRDSVLDLLTLFESPLVAEPREAA